MYKSSNGRFDVASNLIEDDTENRKTRALLSGLTGSNTIIMDAMPGQDMYTLANQVPQVANNKVNEEHIVHSIATEKSLMHGLGKATAVDAFMGNGDRVLTYFAAQNMIVDQESKSIGLIDNVYDAVHAAGFTNVERELTNDAGDRDIMKYSPEAGIRSWVGMTTMRYVIEENYGPLWENLRTSLEHLFDRISFTGNAREQTVKKAFFAGLKEGKKQLLKTLKKPQTLLKGVPERQRSAAMLSIVGRRIAIQKGITDAGTLLHMAKEELDWWEETAPQTGRSHVTIGARQAPNPQPNRPANNFLAGHRLANA